MEIDNEKNEYVFDCEWSGRYVGKKQVSVIAHSEEEAREMASEVLSWRNAEAMLPQEYQCDYVEENLVSVKPSSLPLTIDWDNDYCTNNRQKPTEQAIEKWKSSMMEVSNA